MKKLIVVLVAGLIVVEGAYAGSSGSAPDSPSLQSTNINTTESDLSQVMQGQGYSRSEGGDASAEGGDSSAGAIANISTTSISNYKTRTPPLSMLPPYLPYWTHGGWGTIQAYFPNGPSSDDQVYERTFYPDDTDDMRELRGVLESLPYDGPLKVMGAMLNGVGVAFGGPDNFHHGRGFDIANSLIRARRPIGKPLLVFIDANVDRELLKEAGYAYVGKVSLEGKVNRNWDQVYDAAVAETLPWNVDILLVSGGMKGVTVGSTVAFPGGAGGFSQVNYSLSLFGAMSNGITEGKGEALVSAEGYRYWPQVVNRRRIPKYLYDRIHAKPKPTQDSAKAPQEVPPVTTKEKAPGIRVSQELFEMAGFEEGQRVDYLTIK